MAVIRLTILLVMLPWITHAQEAAHSAQAVAAGLPPTVIKRLQSAPDRTTEAVVMLMAGSGAGDSISRAQVETAIALRLADARAAVLARLLSADLDNDGVVTTAELAALSAASGSRNRGWLAVSAAAADADGDGTLAAEEVRRFAAEEARQDVPDREIGAMRGVLDFDVDRDGTVTLTEFRLVSAAVAALPPPPTEKKGS